MDTPLFSFLIEAMAKLLPPPIYSLTRREHAPFNCEPKGSFFLHITFFLSGIWWKTHIRQVSGFSFNLPSNQERAVFLSTCAHIFLFPFWSGWYALCYFSLILVPCSHLCSGPYYSFSFLKVFNAISIAAWTPLSNGPVFCPS